MTDVDSANLEQIPETTHGWVKVLDHGFVALMDILGSDQRIADAARVSLRSGESYNDGRERTEADNKRLIRYLLSHGHTSPFEMAEVVFVVQAPIFVARQWFRHRTWNYNEISGRYTELPAQQMYLPENSQIHHKSDSIKQGRGEEAEETVKNVFSANLKLLYGESQRIYDVFTAPLEKVESGKYTGLDLAREIARIHLPVSTYTRFYAKTDMNNFLKFLGLRSKPNAQYEIQEYSNAMWSLVKPLFPATFSAWEEHVYNAKRFTSKESSKLANLLRGAETVMSLSDKDKKFIKKMLCRMETHLPIPEAHINS